MPASPAMRARWPRRGGNASGRSSPTPRSICPPAPGCRAAAAAAESRACTPSISARCWPRCNGCSARTRERNGERLRRERGPADDGCHLGRARGDSRSRDSSHLAGRAWRRPRRLLARRGAGRDLDADLFRLSRHRGDRRRRRRGAGGRRHHRCTNRDTPVAGLDDRLDRAGGEKTTGRIRDRAAGAARRRADDRHRRSAPPRADGGGVSALRLAADPRAVAVRLDAVQGAASLRRMSRALRLLQAALTPAIALTFDVPPSLRDTFRFEPGQHLTLRTNIGADDVRRSYSICSAVQDGTLRVAVKKAPGGVFSTWANEHIAPGQTIDVMPPLGHFNVPLAANNRKHYLGFAAGSGITPLLSIVKTTLLTETLSRFTLFYGNRSSSAVMFREELADLKDRFLDRFILIYVMSREPQDIDILNGRIDRKKADALIEHWVDLADIDTAFVCGPDGMMQAVAESLQAHGMPKSRIKIELFAASIPKHERKAQPLPEPGHAECEVTVIIDGSVRQYTLEKTKENILDAALQRGIELPYSCKGGVCSTCRAKLIEGEVDMDVNFALEDYEVARGFILCCQSYPVTDKVVVDFDQGA